MMYRIYCYCSEESDEPDLKMYWNNRLNEWTFGNPSLVNYFTALKFVIDQYVKKEYTENVEDVDGNIYTNYYFYGIEKV